MKYTLSLALLAFGLTACAGQPAPEAADSIGRPVEVGDTIVAMWTRNEYYEGTAEAIDGNFVTVKWANGSTPRPVGLADIYLAPEAGSKPNVKVGDYVLVKHAPRPRWYGARITNMSADAVDVTYTSDGTTRSVKPDEVLAVHWGVAADLAEEANEKK